MAPYSGTNPMPPDPPTPPLGGLSPADLLRQGAVEDTWSGGRLAFVPPSIDELAAAFPQLEVLELIRQGGMSAVYRVRQPELDRTVALKILPPALGDDPSFTDRFTREARALAKLSHPGIVTLHEFGRCSGFHFILMEFVDGVNLRQLLKQDRISPREALAIIPQVCDALQFAHDHGIVHRDIKPENLLIDRLGRVKVADFGLAKLAATDPDATTSSDPLSPNHTLAGSVMGTPSYMAPEQLGNPAEVDHRADIYALGVVLYQMLTGELPSERLEPPSRKVKLDVRLDEIVLQALEKNPELRFQQASVMKTRVEEAQQPLKSTPGHRFRWGVWLQIIGLVLALFGIFQKWNSPAGHVISLSGQVNSDEPSEVLSRLATTAQQLGDGVSVSRSPDSRRWMAFTRTDSEDRTSEIATHLKQIIRDLPGAPLQITEERSSNERLRGTYLLFSSTPVLIGVLTGIAGALILAFSRTDGTGRKFGYIGIGTLLVLLLSIGLLRSIPGLHAFHVGKWSWLLLALLPVPLILGLLGWRSREGRTTIALVWLISLLILPPRSWIDGSSQVPHDYVSVLPQPSDPTTESARQDAASPASIATSWLELLDAENWDKAYESIAPVAAEMGTRDQWSSAISEARAPLGRLLSRTIKEELQQVTELPGAPDGDYMILQADSSFERKQQAVETIVLMKVADEWKPSGYFIR